MEVPLLTRINYITTYRKNDKNIEDSNDIVRLKLNKISHRWIDKEDKKIFQLIYDDVTITRKNNYIVSYNCLNCNRENIICLNNFIKKIEKQSHKCFTCTHGDNIEEKIKIDKEEFELLEDKRKIAYKKRLMSNDQFNRIKKFIISYNNDKYNNINDVSYIPYYRPTESKKYYEPCFYNKELNVISRAINVIFECYHCKNRIKFDSIQPLRKKKYIFCKMCEVQFGPTKYKYESNIEGDNIRFKSKMQYKFLKYCNNNSIIVREGIKDLQNSNINFAINVAFYIPKCNYYIDVVGNLEFKEYNELCLRTQVINNYLQENNNGTYIILHPKNYVSITRKIKFSIENN